MVAAVNVSTHVSQVDAERTRRDLPPPLLAAVGEIERDLSAGAPTVP